MKAERGNNKKKDFPLAKFTFMSEIFFFSLFIIHSFFTDFPSQIVGELFL
jgi:hypothetical protein